MKSTKVIVAAIVVALIVAVGFSLSNGLNEYESIALKDCKTLRNMLKNPDSFTLFDEILIYTVDKEEDKGYDYLVYIPYGGTNSYGGMVQDLAIFKDNIYWGDYDYDEDDFNSQREYDDFLLNGKFYYEFDILMSNNYEDFVRVDADKIMKHLQK